MLCMIEVEEKVDGSLLGETLEREQIKLSRVQQGLTQVPRTVLPCATLDPANAYPHT